ncbi:MAG: AzlC family ABC transporter permease [Pseudomonadota bacterium]
MPNSMIHIRCGVWDTLPLFVPALPFALVFGVVVADSGVAHLVGWSTSPLIFGGAAQMTFLSLVGEGASLAAAVSAALIIGARHLLYSVTLAPRFRDQPRWFRWLGSYVLIDQVFALAVLRKDLDDRSFRIYYLTIGFAFWSLWLVSTMVGIFLGPLVPENWGLTFAAPVLFVGLMVATIDRWEKLAAAAVAGSLVVLFSGMPNKSGLLVGALVGVAVGVLLELRPLRTGPKS